MTRCKDCKWWTPPDYLHPLHTGASSVMGCCELTRLEHEDFRYAKSLAVAVEHDGISAVLNTSPDFGCVQFEAK